MDVQIENKTYLEKKFSWTARFSTLYKLYLSKLWTVLIKDKKSWIFNSLVLILIFAGPIIALITVIQGIEVEFESYFSLFSDIMFVGYIGIIIPLFTLYIASMSFSEEINDRTITYFTVRPIHRIELIITRYLAYITIVPLFISFSLFLIYLSFGIFADFTFFTMALWYLLAAFISTFVYGAFFMFIGLLFKNPLWFGLFFVFIWEFVFASFSQTFNVLTIAFYIKSLIVTDINPSTFIYSPAVIPGNYAYQFQALNNPANPLTYSIIFIIVIIVSLTLSWSRLQGDKFIIPYHAGRRPGGWKYYLKEIRTFLITFGILFITFGMILGPIKGYREDIRKTTTVEFNFSSNPYWDNAVPSISDMGWGGYYVYPFSKGDTLNADYALEFQSSENGLIYGLITIEDLFNIFINDTQHLWMDYRIAYYNAASELERNQLYLSLKSNYSILANELILNSYENRLLNVISDQSIYYSVNQQATLYFMSIITNYTGGEIEYFQAEGSITLNANVRRLSGFILGWILFSFGLFTISFASYSLITYSSADEIRHYEENLSKFSEQELLRKEKPKKTIKKKLK